MPLLTTIISAIIGLILFAAFLFYLWFQYKFSYWSKRGVSGPKPVFPFGHMEDVIKRKVQFFQPYCDSYFKFKHLPYVGMYSFQQPVLSINDPEIAKLVLIKHFDHFDAHGIFSEGKGNPIAGHLFNMHGKTWKNLRAKMSPTFTSGKLKTMYPLVNNVASQALDYANLLHSNGESINFSELYERYAMEIIGSVGFGVECNGFKNPDSEFFRRGNEYFEPSTPYWTFVRALAFIMPKFFNILNISRISPDMVNFFYTLVKETVDYRQKNNYKRNDFLQTLIELRNGQVVDEKGEVKKITDFPFSMDEVVANTMLYMFAGYETSATTGQYAAYRLALNPELQVKAREEINKVLNKHGGEFTYEAQNEMTYINMILDETMRMHPPLRTLFRRCTKDFNLPNSNLTIESGTLVFIPIQAIHMDPEIFPEPEKFDPERFSPDRKANLHPCHWMPFGEGPRKCLGIRQGYIQSKLGLVKMLQKYEFLLDERSPVPIRVKPSSMACGADGAVWLKLKEVDCA